MIKEKTEHVKGFHVHLLPSDAFKTNTFVLQIKAPLEKETVAARALLANVLKSATEQFPSRKDIRAHLDELYGATFGIEVTKKGEHHVMAIRVEVANERYLKADVPLAEKALAFLVEVIFNPFLTEAGSFDERVINTEKQALKQRITSIKDDKTRYANVRLLEEMCKNEPFGLHPYGSIEAIDQLTADDLKEAYNKLLSEDQFDLYAVGVMTEEDVLAALPERKVNINESTTQSKNNLPEEVSTHEETEDIQQSKLHLGFRTPVRFSDAEFAAMQICNGLFGGFPHSKLFVNVREKESLAYYAASRYESHKGLVLALAGIDPKEYDKTRSIMVEQLEALVNGDFSEEELQQTIRMQKNQLLEQSDTSRGLIELSYHAVVSGVERNIADWIQQLEQVTKQDVIDCAAKVRLDTVYFLHGEEA
ncbi:EF-P 5-aminopentanol modification-associated protein YfmF [Salsuginibacillus kocurii]|uniref:EF-P 5-aminopentanol modification-associated protein YfmF n=1 Tax=Salsuginibacillus kocurii TaxID=427078 RepID=UPI00036725EF|nr:pitrilysin family protein [Salsuginibacillus kocurii]